MELGKMLGKDLQRIYEEWQENKPAKQILEDIKHRRYSSMLRKLAQGQSANCNYYGVVPLMVAVHNGDLDAMAILLQWRADPDKVLYGKYFPDLLEHRVTADGSGEPMGKAARVLAQEMLDDPTHRFHGRAAEMLKVR